MTPDPSSSRTIMLADDDPFILALYQSKLNREGFVVIPVSDGEETLSKLDVYHPDLLLLDLNMPRMNGLEVLRYIRAHPVHNAMPIIVLSNACTESMLQEVWKLHPTRFLTKRDTPPNTVIEDIKGIFQALPSPPPKGPPTPAPPPPSTGSGNLEQTVHSLQRFFDCPEGEARQDALLDAYKAVQEHLQILRGGDPRTYAAQYSKAMESLYEDLYARPDCVNPSTCRTLQQATNALPMALHRAQSETPSAMAICRTLLVVEDHDTREGMSQWIDRPGFSLVRTREASMGLTLAEDNRFDLAIFDAAKAGVAEKIKKRLAANRETRPGCTIFLLNPDQMNKVEEDLLDAGTDVATRPAIPSEIILKAAIVNVLR